MAIPALPTIRQDFGTDSSAIAWVMSGFFIASAIFTGIMGRFGDMFGQRRILLVTIGVYGLGSLGCALSPNLVTLVISRVIMGAGAGMIPLCYSIARNSLPAQGLARAMGAIAMMIGLGAGIGMVLGGFIVDHFSWHASFVLAATLSLLAAILILIYVPEVATRSPAKIDVVGATFLACGLGGLLFAISRGAVWGWADTRIISLMSGGFVLLVILVVIESHRVEPLLHIPTLRMRPIFFTNIGSLMMGSGQVAVSILIVQAAQLPTDSGGLGASASASGLLIVPYSIAMVAGSQIAGRSANRFGGRLIFAIGAAFAFIGLMGVATAPMSLWELSVMAGVSGLGISMTLFAAPYLLYLYVPSSRIGEANGTNGIARALGQSFGTQVTAAVITMGGVLQGDPSMHGFRLAFKLSAMACALAIVTSLLIPKSKPESLPVLVQHPT